MSLDNDAARLREFLAGVSGAGWENSQVDHQLLRPQKLGSRSMVSQLRTLIEVEPWEVAVECAELVTLAEEVGWNLAMKRCRYCRLLEHSLAAS